MTTSHVIKPLTPETFPAWLALAQKHNGVWGGCYCSYFHSDTAQTVKSEYDRATFKERLVAEGVAHAALVFDGDTATRGASTAAHSSFRASTTASSTTRARPSRRRGASPASSSTATTGGRASPERLWMARSS